MIFAIETEERSLHAFESEEDATSYCEGLDVEAAVWLFWDDRGAPLEPRFSTPNKRGLFVVRNGEYSLAPASEDHHSELSEAIYEVLSFESPAPLNSLQGVLDYIGLKRE